MADDMNNEIGGDETAGLPDDLRRLLARAEDDGDAATYDPDADSDEEEKMTRSWRRALAR